MVVLVNNEKQNKLRMSWQREISGGALTPKSLGQSQSSGAFTGKSSKISCPFSSDRRGFIRRGSAALWSVSKQVPGVILIHRCNLEATEACWKQKCFYLLNKSSFASFNWFSGLRIKQQNLGQKWKCLVTQARSVVIAREEEVTYSKQKWGSESRLVTVHVHLIWTGFEQLAASDWQKQLLLQE